MKERTTRNYLDLLFQIFLVRVLQFGRQSRLGTFIFLVVASSISQPDVLYAQLPPPQATLDLEWDVVDDAVAYELKLLPKNGTNPIIIKAPENRISQRVPVGVYSVLIRSQDKLTKYFGPWSAPMDIEVSQKIVQPVSPENEANLSESKQSALDVQFEWKALQDAKNYTLKVWSETKSIAPVEVTTEDTKQSVKLATGHVYFWSVTFESTNSIRYQAQPTTSTFNLLGRQLVPPTIDVKIQNQPAAPIAWTSSEGADQYDAKILRHALDEREWKEHALLPKTASTTWKSPRLTPGAYRIEVVAHGRNRKSSEPSVFEFVVKPTAEELEAALRTAR